MEGSATMVTAFTEGLQTLSGNVTDIIGVIAVPAVGIAGTIFIARRVMGWFKSMAK